MKKILVLVESLDINDSSATKGRISLINNLADSGFNLRVCHYTRKHIDLSLINVKIKECIAIPEKKWTLMYFLSRFQRVFTRLTGFNINPFIEFFLGFSFTFFNDSNSIASFLKKQSDFQPDLVLTLSKGASFRSHYAVLKMPQFHSKWMAYIHDPYPFHYYPRPYNWVEPGYEKKEKFFMQISQKAMYSAFPSLLLKEWVGSYFPDFLKTGVVIPHQNSNYNIQDNFFLDYFNDLKFNILHAGNLFKQRSPKGLIEGFKLFLNQNPEAIKDAKLILLGNASYHSAMLKEYEKDNPEIYIYNGNVPFYTVYNLQKNVSVNVILESKSEISPFLPGKFPHCIEANKIILSLAPYYSETRRLLGDDYEYWSEVDDVEKTAFIIEKLYKLWKQNPDNLLLNRKDLEDYLSADYLKKIIVDLQNN